MLKIEELIEPIASKALINRVREHPLWKDLYALYDISLLKVKQVMKNQIGVEEAGMLRHDPSYFYQKVEDEEPFKQNCYPNIDNESNKG